MADIAPLTPLRYDLQTIALEQVVAPPYDVISPPEREELEARHPHNVVRLILPQDQGGEVGSRYAAAAATLASMRSEGVLRRDEEPAFYRYDQTFTLGASGLTGGEAGPVRRRGFLAAVRLAPFSERVVLPHERTLSGPKEDRLRLFRATRTNLSPGFMLYRDKERSLDGALETGVLLSEFTTRDGVVHSLAKITDPEAMRAIKAKVSESALLIADGHHRYETAVRYAGEVAEANPGAPRDAEFRYFMAFLANGDDPDLVVLPTHRHVHSLPSFSFDALLEKASALFEVTRLPEEAQASDMLRELALTGGAGRERGTRLVACAPDGRAALLSLREGADLAAHPVLGAQIPELRATDVAILHGAVLEGMCGITREAQAAKTNLYYPQSAESSLEELRSGKGDVLFLMNATPTEQVRRVAEAGEVMPQKSTFFYPKVLTGLAIHTLEPGRSMRTIG